MSTTPETFNVSLTREQVEFLEDALQRDAVGLLRHPDPSESVTETLASPVYRQNRDLFGVFYDLTH